MTCACDPTKCDGPVPPPDYVVHATCDPRAQWCPHLHIHMPPTQPRPMLVYPRKARRAAADAATKWQRQHPVAVLWAMRVPIDDDLVAAIASRSNE